MNLPRTTNLNPPDVPVVRNSFLKFIYASMLLWFPETTVRSFWDHHRPPSLNRQTSDLTGFYNWLWDSEMYADISYLVGVITSLDIFFKEHDTDLYSFINNALQIAPHGLPIPPGELARWYSGKVTQFLSTGDPRKFILDHIGTATANLFPGLIHQVLATTSHTRFDGYSTTLIVARTAASDTAGAPTSPLICSPLLPFDLALWTVSFVQSLPRFLSLHPYEELSMIADPRPVQHIVFSIDNDNGNYLIDGEVYGITTDFTEFCRELHLADTLQSFRYPPRRVVVMVRDYFCPIQNRVLLQKGCAYGAPIGLYRLGFRSVAAKPAELLPAVINHITDTASMFWPNAQDLHRALLHSIAPEIRVVYHVGDESISINNTHLVKQVPAGILRYILSRYVENRQTEFEYREFLLNANLTFDVYAPNISVRIKRLERLLARKLPHVKLIPSGRGKFSVEISCKLSYEEQ